MPDRPPPGWKIDLFNNAIERQDVGLERDAISNTDDVGDPQSNTSVRRGAGVAARSI